MPRKFNSQGGALPILILLATVGLLGFLLISNTFDFRDTLFSRLFPKPSSQAAQPESPSVPDEILLKFKPGVSEKAKDAVLKEHGMEIKDSIPQIDVILAHVPEQAKDRVIEALKHNPRVEFAEPNYLGQPQDIPNDPKYIRQWHLPIISAPSAWDISKGSSSIVVAVIDIGVESTHEDLAGKIVPGYNFADNTTDTSDVGGHGTAVSGIVTAATNNAIGIASLGWNVSVMPLRVMSADGSGMTYFNIARAVLFAAGCDTNGANCGVSRAKVINMSLGGTSSDITLQSAINTAWGKGLVIAAAAGNETTTSIVFPASGDNVVAVGATTDIDVKEPSSNIGPELDVMAPGSYIYSTDRGNTYSSFSFTSFATPLVAGLAALIMSANPGLTNPQQVVDIINQTADKIDSTNHPYTDLTTNNCNGWNSYYGCGRINAAKALQKATGITPPPPDTTPPTVSISSPTGGTISGLVDITATATDNVGVTKVEFYIDGVLFASDLTSLYLASWDTTLTTNGSHTLLAKAYDLANNVGSSSSITVTVNNISPTPTPVPTSTPSTNSLSISNVSISTTGTTATISWTTNTAATSQVFYGLSLTNLNQSSSSTSGNSITLTGLSKSTKYYFQIRSNTSSGLQSTYQGQFRTKNR